MTFGGGKPIETEDWTSITQDEFDEFRVSGHYIPGMHNNSLGATTPVPVNPSLATKTTDPVADFKKGIRRDAMVFTEDVGKVLLAPAYVPPASDSGLFSHHQTYVYSVLQRTIQFDKGKSLVKKFSQSMDAQKLLIELVEFTKESPAARLSSQDYLTYLTSSSVDDGKWKGTTSGYVLHFIEQIRLYNSHQKPGEVLTEILKTRNLGKFSPRFSRRPCFKRL